MGQTVTTLANENPITNSLVKPTMLKDVVLLSPGTWVGEDNRATDYTAEQIKVGFQNTDWTDMNLFLDHKDTKSSAVSAWVGFVRNVRIEGDELIGDLEIWHPLISLFIKQAKVRFGVSASMQGEETINHMGGPSEYSIHSFRSMSIVDEPGSKHSWLPKMLAKGKDGDKSVVNGLGVHRKDKNKSSHSEDEEEEEESSHLKKKKKHLESNLKSMKGGKKVMEKNMQKEKVEEVKAKNLSSETESEESENQESGDSSSEDVKSLSNKVDKLTDAVMSISETLKTLSAAGEESKEEEPVKEEASEESESDSSAESSEEPKEEKSEESSEDGDANKELEKARSELVKTNNKLSESDKELLETKKELSSLKEEVNSPDRKTLASSNSNVEVSSNDANAGMLGFLRERADIPIY